MTKEKLSNYFFFKWKEQAAIMAVQGAVKVNGEKIESDTQLLFQQLIIAAKSNLESAL